MPSSNEERTTWLARKPDLQLAKKLRIGAWLLSATVFILVGLMRRPELRIPLPDGVDLSFLPAVNAVLNTFVAIFIVSAIVAVKRGDIARHRRFISMAMVFSLAFLLSYTAYHFTTEETRYGGAGVMRGLYLVVLASHIILAGVSLPLILLTWIRGATNQFTAHRRMARPVALIWLYVAITGPVCYLMLRPYY